MNLHLSLIHFDVAHKQNRQNQKNLLVLVRQAAEQGADIILTPEMSLSGYSFKDRQDIAAYVEDENSRFLSEVAEIAADHECYIGGGLAVRDGKTDIFYNTLLITGPEGVVCNYRKINAESRWACPGDPKQENTFQTKWGRIGVMICSDTYYGLLPRVTALKGADLLLVAANWPPSGLDPVELWQARALENGVTIAVCNRTGKDLNMDCRKAESCLIDDTGAVRLRRAAKTSTIINIEIPLDNGRLNSNRRNKALAGRQKLNYHSCYRNLAAINNLTSYYTLPQPGILNLRCVTGLSKDKLITALDNNRRRHSSSKAPELLLLPTLDYNEFPPAELGRIARRYRLWLISSRSGERRIWSLFKPDGQSAHWNLPSVEINDRYRLPFLEIGPARVAIVTLASLRHPEFPLALAKQGCDLLVASEKTLSQESILLSGAATLNHLAVAVCTGNGAGIWMHPEGHQRWWERLAQPGKTCTFNLDTTLLRQKRFQDRVDFDRLFLTTM